MHDEYICLSKYILIAIWILIIEPVRFAHISSAGKFCASIQSKSYFALGGIRWCSDPFKSEKR
jgi:hypothetical protein